MRPCRALPAKRSQGDFEAAIASYALSLDAAARSGDEAETCYELQGVAMTLAGLGQAEHALRIAGAADRQLRSLGIPNDDSVAFWEALLDRFIGGARDVLGAEADAVWEAGGHLDLRAAVAEALALAGSRA